MTYKIYHNPRCQKSRVALKALEETGADVEVVQYLKEIPSAQELKDVLMKLNLKPLDIIRIKEADFKPLKGLSLNDEEWIEIMREKPKLIERPIVVKGARAVIARTPDAIERILA